MPGNAILYMFVMIVKLYKLVLIYLTFEKPVEGSFNKFQGKGHSLKISFLPSSQVPTVSDHEPESHSRIAFPTNV